MKTYTLEELKTLRNIRSAGFDDKHADDIYSTDKDLFLSETDIFFNWIEKMEQNGRIEYLLKNPSD